MKKVLLLVVLLLTAVSLSAVRFESNAAFNVLEHFADGGGGGSSDTVAPVIHFTVTKNTFLIYEEDMVFPSCYVTDNVNTNLQCNFDTSMINFAVPGTYTLRIYAYDYSGNYKNEYVSITMLPSGTYYNLLYNDDYDFRSKLTTGTTNVKVGFDDSRTVDSCSSLGSPYEMIDTVKKGRFITYVAWSIGDPLYSYSSGDYYYEYDYLRFRYNKYEIYDVCQKKMTFDKTLLLSNAFDGIALWTRNDTVSIPNKSTTYVNYYYNGMYMVPSYITYYDYTAMELYITHSALEYTESLINNIGITDYLSVLEQTLENPYVNFGFKLSIAAVALLVAPKAALAVGVSVWALDFVLDALIDLLGAVTIDKWIEDLYDEDYIEDTIDQAIMNNHGLKLTYNVSGVHSILFGMPVSINLTSWNQNQSLNRVLNTNEFGTFEFVSENELHKIYANG
ncbi:MAG: hypothetical protein KKH92_01265 [Firmicutes bacterium]|nr:hypothetical protein [Bacillota bacterium]